MPTPLRNLCFLLTIPLLLLSVTAATATPLQDAARDAFANTTASVVRGEDGWLFLKEELQHLAAGKFWGDEAKEVSRSKKKNYADPKPAILKYNKDLAEKGITLYLMPVPPKALIYPEKLKAGLTQEATAEDVALYSRFFKELSDEGVEVIDLLPTLLAQKKKMETPLYCRTDTHYSGAGLMLFARAAAERLQKAPWYPAIPKEKFTSKPATIAITGDLMRMSGEKAETEGVELSLVSREVDGALVASDPASPVILLGDSHALVFQAGGDLYAKGGGLFDVLSAKLGFAVDLLGVRGSGVTPARINLYQRAKKDPGYLTPKKAVIWCFTARDFTGRGGWREIPVAP